MLIRALPLFLILASGPAGYLTAQDTGDADKKEKPGEDFRDPPPDPVVTQREIRIRGQAFTYTATAGVLKLRKPDGEPRADIFHVSYQKVGVSDPSKRPVCFCFNGGPGSSSVWLHLGAFGPKRVVLAGDGTVAPPPPYALTDNDHTLLPACDLVFIDPVSTGLSRPEKGEDPKQFHGYSEDVESVGDFIRLWVTKNRRWQSPKFLMGESYGGIRGAGLAAHLQDRYGMYLNGLIVVSGLFDFRTLQASEQNDVPYTTFLPAMTASAFHHRRLSQELMADFEATVRRAEEFARGEYAAALLMGGDLPADRRSAAAKELALLTGLPEDFILRQNLRIDPGTFRRKLLEDQDLVTGRFDARVTGRTGDPSYDVVFGAFATTLNAYLRNDDGLRFPSELPYEILNPRVNPWNYGSFVNRYVEVTSELQSAMLTNSALRLFIACGYYDLATPPEAIKWSVRHLDLPDPLRQNIEFRHYHGGHMMYTNLPELEKLTQDIIRFIGQSVP